MTAAWTVARGGLKMRAMTLRLALVVLCLAGLAEPAAGQIAGPANVFTTGTTIVASEVNTNFSTVYANALNRTGGTMTGALVFSADNTHDIGASGTTRPRDLFLGRNATIGGTLSVTGAVTFGGAVTFSGGANSIPETAITDGAVLARLAGNETISGAYTFTSTTGLSVSSTQPIVKLIESGATANEGRWRLIADGDALTLQALNDAESSSTNVFTTSRTGHTIDTVTFGATQTVVQPCSGGGCATAPSLAVAGALTSGISLAIDGSGAARSVGTAILAWNSGGVTITGAIALSSSAGVGLAVDSSGGSTPVVFNRVGGDGTIVEFESGGVSQGSVSIAGATTAYNTFMGAHYTQLRSGQSAPETGTLVVAAGVINAKPRRLTRKVRILDAEGLAIGEDTIDDGPAPIHPDAERFVHVRPSSRRNQRGVYGVWFADLGRTAAGMSWGDPDAHVYQVAGVGLTTAWVTDTCGQIETGNLLASSPREGLAERQCTVSVGGANGYDPVVRDYTLGKALVDVNWATVAPDADGVRKVRIPVVLMAG
jgi:hypothetical protein